MRFFSLRSYLLVAVVGTTCGVATREPALAELHWQPPKKEQMRVRLVALAIAYPKSSFFSSQEVFVAEQELEKDETRLIKLVYNYLPYQPPLSEYGLDYSIAHEIRATRDPDCDEPLSEMGRQGYMGFKYSADSPVLDLGRRRLRLRCYQTSAEDYDRPLP